MNAANPAGAILAALQLGKPSGLGRMDLQSTFMPSVDEGARRRFEAAWREENPQPIEDFLPPADDPHYLATLEELVHIELEFVWKLHGQLPGEEEGTLREPPRLESYLERFPPLNQPDIVKRLGEQEYQVRMRYGSRPILEEYRLRFPDVSFTDMGADATALTWRVAVDDHPQIPGYEILGVLGRGGMGVVYKARQLGLNRVVALKMILAGGHAGPEELQRFRAEAEAVARLHNPHIVQIHEIGERDGRPYFSLEYVDGGSLAQKLGGTPLAPEEAAPLLETLARAVHYAHQRGIIHRDLKPANILLRAGTPLISDFGLAKQLDADAGQTRTGQIMGTPSYMAPEQAIGRGREIGPATDVYALGAVLYEMVTGRPPFKAATVLDTLEQVRVQEPVPPSRLQPKVPRDLETICLKCLQKEPRKRYASALDLAEDLRRFHAGEPIRARPVRVWERALKSARRRPAVAAFLASLVFLLGSVVGVIAWHYTDLTEQLKEKTAELNDKEKQRRQEKEKQRLDVMRDQFELVEAQKRTALEGKDWANAKLLLSRMLAKLDSEPALPEDLATLLGRLRKEDRHLDRARAEYKQFMGLRDQALFHETLLTGLDAATDRKKTRLAAEAALALYGVKVDSTASPAIPVSYLSKAEEAEIREGLYELLLVLAEVVAHPYSKQQAARALSVLDRAAQLLPPSRAYHLRRARYLAKLGDDAAAKKERALAEAPQPATVFDRFLVGEDWYKQEKLDQAIRSFTAALQAQPDHFWSQYFLAVCYLKLPQPRFDLARINLSACVARRQDFTWVYLLRGYTQTELGEFELAGADFEEALRKRPDQTARYAIYVNRGVLRIKQARSVEAAANLSYVSAMLSQPACGLACAGLAHRYKQQRLAEAVADLQEAVRRQPKDYHQAFLNLAQAYQAQGQLDQALAQLDRAIKQAPALAALYRERAQLHLQRQDWSAAQHDFERAADLDRKRAGTSLVVAADYVEIGRLLFRSARYEEVVKMCETALEVRPDYAAAQRWRAEAMLKLGRFREAVAALEEYEKTGRPVAEVYRARGLCREKLGAYAAAVADYTRALALVPDPAVYVHRGWVYLLIYDAPKLALADFEEAIRRAPQTGDALNGRGYARVQLGDYRAAVEDGEEAIRRGPESARLLYNAARIFAQAAGKIDAQGAKAGRTALEERARYHKRALDLIRKALERLPDGQRPAFWRSYIRTDAALLPVARSYDFAKLARAYSGR